jgi:hypothetical protein
LSGNIQRARRIRDVAFQENLRIRPTSRKLISHRPSFFVARRAKHRSAEASHGPDPL